MRWIKKKRIGLLQHYLILKTKKRYLLREKNRIQIAALARMPPFCPARYKENSIEMHFDEHNFTFRKIKLIPTDSIVTEKTQQNQLDKVQSLKNIAEIVFRNGLELNYSDLCEKMEDFTRKSLSSVKRQINDMKELEIIEVQDKKYRFSTTD